MGLDERQESGIGHKSAYAHTGQQDHLDPATGQQEADRKGRRGQRAVEGHVAVPQAVADQPHQENSGGCAQFDHRKGSARQGKTRAFARHEGG